jgi:putative hemolysin
MATITPVHHDLLPLGHAKRTSRYRPYFAATEDDRRKAYRLRFLVFNLELNEGLESAYQNGLDRDEFDDCCEHLLVEDCCSGEVVGTYRMQSGATAAKNRGYYSEREFDLTPFQPIRRQVLELGRACVHREHRNFEVLNLLWKGIAQYAASAGARYLMGCSSLTSQEASDGWRVYRGLQKYVVDQRLMTAPRPAFGLPVIRVDSELAPPKLLRAYLAIGAKICGPPAIDREFKTIDFLTLLDLDALPASIRARYLRGD